MNILDVSVATINVQCEWKTKNMARLWLDGKKDNIWPEWQLLLLSWVCTGSEKAEGHTVL